MSAVLNTIDDPMCAFYLSTETLLKQFKCYQLTSIYKCNNSFTGKQRIVVKNLTKLNVFRLRIRFVFIY